MKRDTLLDELEKDPYQGSSLGRGVRKVRMAIASKGKGKSDGARVNSLTASNIFTFSPISHTYAFYHYT